MTRGAACVAGYALALAWTCVATAEDTAASARYAVPLEAELRQLGIAAQCTSESPSRHHCRWTRPSGGTGELVLHAVYSDDSDTVYFYLERWLTIPSDHPRAAAVLRRLMELNWELLIGKFEWSARTGEVRLSATLNTDSNFDRRAFRSILRAIDSINARYGAELRDLAGP